MVKEKWSTIKSDVLVLPFIFFVPMSKTISVINRSGVCYFLHSSNWHNAGMSTRNHMHQMEKNVTSPQIQPVSASLIPQEGPSP